MAKPHPGLSIASCLAGENPVSSSISASTFRLRGLGLAVGWWNSFGKRARCLEVSPSAMSEAATLPPERFHIHYHK